MAYRPFQQPSNLKLKRGRKILETHAEEFDVGSRNITLETGKLARFANDAVILAMEETTVLSTVSSAKSDGTRDFQPLTVDYQEKQFAQGVIPNTFMRREGAPKERELLCGRIIDRPIRPLFPSAFYHEVQVMASVLSSDGRQDPDVMAANAASAALMLSDIPWGGPIGVIRIGRIDGKFIVNPSMDELSLSDLNLVYACTRDKTLMIDVQAHEISEKDLEAALRLAHPEFERGEALDNITQDVKKTLEEECDEEGLKFLSKTVDTLRKQVVRKRILGEGLRVDGRCLDEVRPLYCEAGNLPVLHGSAIFSRGDTQVLCTVTLGAPGEAQRLESLVGPPSKRFMLHYSFPPFCINEVGKRVGLNRREVGHGTLAEKALLAVLPPEDNCPYTVRINAEVMASDGSTSMASVCAGSMALMDAGIPLKEHVAGLSVGLISEIDPATGAITDYRILTDILGLEDHLGDMDFKIAGTRNGITAIQLDIKPAGIPLDLICECFEPAYKGRLQILDHMDREINVPRAQDYRFSPQILTLKYSNDVIRRLIGPLGTLKRKIEEETGGRISVSDGFLTVVAKNQLVLDKLMEKIHFIVGCEIEKGGVYKGVVTSIKEYGAFVEFNGGQQGLLHISELSHEPVSQVSDIVSVGQTLNLMCIGVDVRGNIKLSLKATSPRQGSKINDTAGVSVLSVQQTPKVREPVSNVQKPANRDDQPSRDGDSLSSIVIRSVADCDPENSAALREDSIVEAPINANRLRLGMEVTAKVHQIRAHGLVLDLGGGVRGMYRFESGFRKDFEVGEEIRVKCSSFSTKGIPVMSLVDWGEASMIQAERILLQNALMHPLNESCIPLYNFSYVYDYIMSTSTSFVDSFADTKEGRYNPKMDPVIPVDNWRKGSQPADASKEHNCIPDEHYVQTLLAQKGLEGEITRRSLTHSSWDLSSSKDPERRGWHPLTYKLADASPTLIQSIKDIDNIYYETEFRREWCTSKGKPSKCFLFARKFTRPAALRLLNMSLLGISSEATSTAGNNFIEDH
ncbi:polyribonucleotide nucleotidyltransferase 2, mitochondrial [Dorcoceras hygrometricum]|uniref:polyribonucleotide nucleotidyltransferase n=1 Tax=Dorcoceras hygrometricum TaxID=472368 RepID=A0A2Z7CF78_9LAMI|nr:polyribonucleotide nucleotidyltransferase 2, mitochondrial [Dorcoceras hygrometricum]